MALTTRLHNTLFKNDDPRPFGRGFVASAKGVMRCAPLSLHPGDTLKHHLPAATGKGKASQPSQQAGMLVGVTWSW